MSTGLPRVVELIRVSTDGQEKKATHQVQRDALDALRKTRPGTVVERLEALGVSGAKGVAERKDLQELVRLSKAKAFDELRVFSVDRLTRSDDPRERFAIYGAAMDAGAKIVDCSNRVIDPNDEGGMGELDFYLQTMFAARERKKIAQRTVAGKKLKASQGKMVHGIPPYGRRFNKATSQWELVPEEVEVYRRIIDACLAGHSLLNIARALNAEGVPAKRTGWGAQSIMRLLTKPTIVGLYTAFGHTMHIPPITTEAEWERIKATLAQRLSSPVPKHALNAMLRGHAHCKACGMPLWVLTSGSNRGQPRYGCPKPSKRDVPCPDRRTIGVTEADEHVRSALLNMVRRPEVFERALADNNGPTDPQKAFKALEKDLGKLAGREAKTLKLYNEGFLSEGLAKTELSSIQVARKALQDKKATLREQAPDVPLEDLQALRAELAEAVEQATPARIKELIAILRPAVTLGADGIEISGEVCAGDKSPRRSIAGFVPHGLPFKMSIPLKLEPHPLGIQLSAAQVTTIRHKCAAGMSQKEAGALYGVGQPVVSRIVNGQRRA